MLGEALLQDEFLQTASGYGLHPALADRFQAPAPLSELCCAESLWALLPLPAGFSVQGNIWPRWFGFDGVWQGATENMPTHKHVWLPNEEAAAPRPPSTFGCAQARRSCLRSWLGNEELLIPIGLNSSFAPWF